MYIQHIKNAGKNNTSLSKAIIETYRKEISEFLSTIRDLSNEITEIDSLKSFIWSIIYVMDTFNKMPDTIFTASSKNLGISEYQLIHGHLDWKWLTLTTLFKISVNISEIEREKLIKFHFIDLIYVSRIKFNQNNITELITTRALPCLCFREYYILLQMLMEKHNLSFWSYFNDCLKNFNEANGAFNSISMGDMDRNSRNMDQKNQFHFYLWLICEIAESQCYNDSGVYLGITSYRVSKIL